MPRAARAREATNHKFPPTSVGAAQGLPVIDVEDLTPEEQEELLKQKIQAMNVWQICQKLPDNLQDCICYVYRTDPKIEAQGDENKCIAKYPARAFDEATLLADHGGGGYKVVVDARIGAQVTPWKVTRYFTLPGTAKIPQRFVVVDNAGKVVDKEKQVAEEKQAGELVRVLQTVVDALQRNQGDSKAAIADAMQVMKQANLGAVEVLATAAKAAAEGKPAQGDSRMDKLVDAVIGKLVNKEPAQGDSRMDKLFDALLAQLVSKASEPPPKPPDPLETLKTLGGLLADDNLGGLKTILGAGKAKEDSVWEKGLGVLFEAGAEAVKSNAPAIIDWLQRRAWYNYTIQYMQQQRAGAQPPDLRQNGQTGQVTQQPQQPAAPVPILPRPQPQPVSQPAASAAPAPPMPGTQQPTEAQMKQGVDQLIFEITGMIADYWDNNCDGPRDQLIASGAQAAVAVKAAHPTLVPFLRMRFKSLAELIEFARKDHMLEPAAEESDFPAFAEQFFTEFHKADA